MAAEDHKHMIAHTGFSDTVGTRCRGPRGFINGTRGFIIGRDGIIGKTRKRKPDNIQFERYSQKGGKQQEKRKQSAISAVSARLQVITDGDDQD